MKTLLFIFCMAAAMAAGAQNDTIPFSNNDSVEFYFSVSSIYGSNNDDIDFEVMLDADSAGKLSNHPYDLKVYGDTACAIIYLMQQMKKTNELLWAAEDVLSYMKTDGRITNWRKWNAATKRYMKLKKEFTLY